MGYTKQNGQFAKTEDVTLVPSAARTAAGNGVAVELGDRGNLRLTLEVTAIFARGTDEVQAVAVADADGGTFTLSFGGQTTAPLPHDATAAQVQAALRALSTIGPTGVNCAGGPLGTAPVTVTFVGALAQTNVAEMTADDALLTGEGAAATVSTATPGVAGDPKLNVKVEHSPTGADSSWVTLGNAFTEKVATGSQRLIFTGVDRFVRAAWTINDEPQETATFSVVGEAV
jgi:hypothetical protein